MWPIARLGQNFLIREDIADRIIDAAQLSPGERVLEIGPGPGILTARMTAVGVALTAIELDDTLGDAVERKYAEVTLVRGDAARVEWPPFDKLVANLPFQISSPVLFRLAEATGWTLAVVMVQKEFGDRMVAKPDTPDYGRLTVKLALSTEAKRVLHVPKSAFRPPPKVAASVIVLTPKPRVPVKDAALLDILIDHVFTQRRKMLRTSVRDLAQRNGHDAEAWGAALDGLGWAQRRPGELPPAQFVRLADALAD